MERLGLAEPETRRKMRETDSNRAAYIKQLYGRDWCDPDEYDIVINTGRISYATAAEMILRGVHEPAVAPVSS
jgi:cytidylate kinase